MDEDLQILDEIEDQKSKDKEDLRSVLNKKSYSGFELDEVMMEEAEI